MIGARMVSLHGGPFPEWALITIIVIGVVSCAVFTYWVWSHE